jgi:GT2 family glycosyltransferase
VVRLLDADLGIAACQPKIRSAARRDHFEYAGAAGGFIDSLGYPFCRGRIFDTLEADHGQYDAAGEIFWGSGACLFVRAASFRRCGGFDASFFAHMEEIDLCWRLKAAGERIWYCPDAVVYHVGGGTLPKSDARKTFLNFRNNLRMLRRNLDAPSFFRILFSRCLLDMAAAVRYLLILKPAESLAVLRAYLSLAAPAGKPGVARMTRRRFRNLTGVFSGSIVSAYYLGGKKRFTRLDEQRFASSASKGAGKS